MMPIESTRERTFSKLISIKNQLRNCIECDMVKQIDFTEVVNDFAEQEVRKKCF